jgi:hypothetical protein
LRSPRSSRASPRRCARCAPIRWWLLDTSN